MTDLHDLLDRTTDRIEGPDLVARALRGARRRRTAHRGALAAGVVAVVVVGVAVAGQLGGESRTVPPALLPSSPTSAPTEQVAQPTFDPANVDELPAAPDGIAPSLPDVIEPPAISPWLADDPVDAAVLAIKTEDSVAMLTIDGTWRSVPYDPILSGAELSPDGSRLAVGKRSGVDVWDLATGESTHWDRPAGFTVTDGDYGWWRWLDDERLWLAGRPGGGGWEVDADTGETTEVAYPLARGDVNLAVVDDTGVVVESSYDFETSEYVDWASGSPRRLELSADERLDSLAVRGDTVAAVRSYTVVVADRATLTPSAVLPFVDEESSYVGGRLPVVAVLGDGTVLLQVPRYAPRAADFSWRLVAWQPGRGDLSVVTRGDSAVPASYAVGLLG